MNNEEKYLHKLLRGENMGINLYEKYLNKLPAGQIKNNVETYLDEHKRHRNRLESLMQSKGINTNNEIGLLGNMTEAVEGIKLEFKNNPNYIMKRIYKGENMGLKHEQKYLEEISSSIRPDLEKIAKEDSIRVKQIHDMMNDL